MHGSLSAELLPVAALGVVLAAASYRADGRMRGHRGDRHGDRQAARWARRSDLRALALAEPAAAGRLVLGSVHGAWRATSLAAERAHSVVVVGPTQSGKTTCLAVPAIVGWDG